MREITVIGAGLAGAEAAWQAASFGFYVKLFEMRPKKMTPAHQTADFAELVCSNSLRAANVENAVGLLKEEMRRQNSLIISCADAARLPAGGALAVDREFFAHMVTKRLSSLANISIIRDEVQKLPEVGPVVIASGPLTSDALAKAIAAKTSAAYLYFHDAVAPIVAADSIDRQIVFKASRYGKGESPEGDYLNCPMNKEEYEVFLTALLEAERVPLKDFENEKDFEGCMPIETMARRGKDAIRFGPMKPVGLVDPKTGHEPYAVVQLRQDNQAASQYNIVGFQTRLTWPAQKRVFALIPGLANAEFLRLGVMHRNTYIDSPRLLNADLTLKTQPDLLFAGQITGVEGYVESAACGLSAGINAARITAGKKPLVWPTETALGSLLHYITSFSANFQPSNITFGLFPPLTLPIKNKKERNEALAKRALAALEVFGQSMD